MQYFVFPANQCMYNGFDIKEAERIAGNTRGGLICEVILPGEGPRAVNPSSASPEHGQQDDPSSRPEPQRELCETP
ncbi:hypothetical protein UFOVP1229_42 [uncultured Caudovirales phage]|uniref:Uncharacterized protein n=1 Tax=uncultured Caudovirales phage TaxID=2100421 RepID=A0A6J5RGT3_9CAUD|nr:hypothetical protein UFOVP1229_42 [uncultured Caudovirales phage]